MLNQQDDKVRIIVDTNLWISFLIGRKLDILLNLIGHPRFQLVSTELLYKEIYNVSLRPKFRKYFSIENAISLLTWMNANTLSFELKEIPIRCRDPKDDYLLELAVQAKAIYLVSGDSDLLELGNIEGCRIMTVAQFEEECRKLFFADVGIDNNGYLPCKKKQ